MIDPALFTVQRSGRVEVALGRHIVGFIEPWDGPQRRGGSGPIGAYYWIMLPIDGGGSAKRPAATLKLARRLILQRLADWYGGAGPLFEPVAQALAIQAESERAVA